MPEQPLEDERPNFDESQVIPYTLPDPLRFLDGHPVRTALDWTARRA